MADGAIIAHLRWAAFAGAFRHSRIERSSSNRIIVRRRPSTHLAARPRTAPLRVFPERWRDHDGFAGIPARRKMRSQLIGKVKLFVDLETPRGQFFCHLRTPPDYVSFAQHAPQNALGGL
jgi:hypothetical protein